MRYLVIAVVFLFALPGNAEAINRDQVPAMNAVAVAYFGPLECGEVAYSFVSAASLQGEDAPLGAVARGGGCRTRLGFEYFDAASWVDACETVVHEYGHSVQEDWDPVAPDIQAHSPDKNSIMYADDTLWPFAPCVQADPTHNLEQRCWRLEEYRWKMSDRTLDARRALRKLTKRKLRGRRRVRHWRHAYEVARADHRSCLAELRTYGVGQ